MTAQKRRKPEVWSWGYLETKYGEKWDGASLRDNSDGTTDVLMWGRLLTPKQAALVTAYVAGDPSNPNPADGRVDFE